MPSPPPLTGAILVGGRSSRMGADKALLPFYRDAPLVRTLVGALNTVCDEVLLVGGDPRRFDALELSARWIPDAPAGRGPLAGVLGALRAARHDHCLIVACDMPFVSPAVVAAFAHAPRDCQVLAYPGPDGLEPLLAVYAADCEPALAEMLEAGAFRARDALRRLEARALPADVVAAADPQSQAAMNVNSPEDLASARSALD